MYRAVGVERGRAAQVQSRTGHKDAIYSNRDTAGLLAGQREHSKVYNT